LNDINERLRRLAIAVETLATIVLERMPMHQTPPSQPHATKRKASTSAYWIKYVIGPVAIGVSTHLLARLFGK
jgi:hypothetical protein